MNERRTILIVDDDQLIRKLLTDFLSPDYEILTAEDGAHAWEILQQSGTAVDILLSDIQMPNMDGVDLLKRVQKHFPKICTIMISGTADAQRAVEAMRQGAYDYITKPIKELEIINIFIQRWIEHQSLEAKLSQYAELHRDMMQSMKVRTFLAIDVAGSRQLKLGEDPFLAQFSFVAFHQFIEAIVRENNGDIHSTAGDGVMACFVAAADAVAAARSIFGKLDDFNRTKNRLQGKFRLRMGIHTGSVIVEKSGRINEMFSEALDVAGHIQKTAKPDQIEISKDTLNSLEDRSQWEATDHVLDGDAVYTRKQTL